MIRQGFRLHYVPMFLFAAATITAFFIIATTIECRPSWLARVCIPHAPAEVASVSLDQAFTELRARLMWSISALFAVMGILVTMIGALCVIWMTTPRVALRWIAGGLVALFPLLIGWRYGGASFEFNEVFLKTVYEAGGTRSFVAVIEGAAHATLIALVVAVSMVLRRIGKLSAHAVRADSDGPLTELSNLHGLLRMLLFLGALSLVAGTLETAALYHWASFFLGGTPYFRNAAELSTSMALLIGIYYSVLLATIFGPALILTRYYFGRVAQLSTGDSESNSAWLAQHRLEETLANKVWATVAVLAPALIGAPLSQILQALSS